MLFLCQEHEAGVTAGCWHPNEAHTFASGSYDEHVRIWDARSLRSPVNVWDHHCIGNAIRCAYIYICGGEGGVKCI